MKETARERSWPVLHENALVPPRFPVLVLRHVASPPPGQRVPTKDGTCCARTVSHSVCILELIFGSYGSCLNVEKLGLCYTQVSYFVKNTFQ